MIETYANTDLFVFCYDHTNQKTLSALKKYYEEVKDFLEMDEVTDRDAVKILVACKADEPASSSSDFNVT